MPYRLPLSFLLPRLPSYLLGRQRPLRSDFRALFDSVGATPRVEGAERIPGREAFVAVTNHFHRPDLPAWWLAMAVNLAIADRRFEFGMPPPIGVIATQWTYPDRLRQWTVAPTSRLLFARIIRAYGLLGMEPPTLGESATDQRARSVRRVIEAARSAKRNHGVLMIAPEGGDAKDGAMVRPPAGAGRFLALLGATGLAFLPMAAWADGEQIIVVVGECFRLAETMRVESASGAKQDLDESALRAAMGRVAALLPKDLRGYYG